MWTVTAAQPPPTPSEHFEECCKTVCFVSCPPCCCCLCWSCSSCGVVRVGSRALTLRQQVQDPTSWSGLEQLVTATAPLMDQKYALDAKINQKHKSASNSNLSSGEALKQYGARLCSNPRLSYQGKRSCPCQRNHPFAKNSTRLLAACASRRQIPQL